MSKYHKVSVLQPREINVHIKLVLTFPDKGSYMRMDILCHGCGQQLNIKKHDKDCDAKIKHACHLCEKHFDKLKYLKQHCNSHKNENLKCHICGKYFKSKTTWNMHVKNVHVNKHDLFVCPICNATFSTNFNLNKHCKLHDEKLFSCSKCSKCFHQKYNRDQHFKSCKK